MRLAKVEEIWRNRLVKIEGGYAPRRKEEGMLWDGPEVEKHIEAEIITCFEFTLYQSCESKEKKNRVTEDYVSPSVFIS